MGYKNRRKNGLWEEIEGKMSNIEGKMRNITIAIPEIYIKNLEWLKKNRKILNRSEGIRSAISTFLDKEEENSKLLNNE